MVGFYEVILNVHEIKRSSAEWMTEKCRGQNLPDSARAKLGGERREGEHAILYDISKEIIKNGQAANQGKQKNCPPDALIYPRIILYLF